MFKRLKSWVTYKYVVWQLNRRRKDRRSKQAW